jgi:hypothetical protein
VERQKRLALEFGTGQFQVLLDIHCYSDLATVVALVVHFYGLMLQRMGLR